MESALPNGQQHNWGQGPVMDDQVALNRVLKRRGSACRAWYIPSKFLVFAADYRALLLGHGAVLVHVTHTARARLTGRWGWLHQTLARLLWGYRAWMMHA